jgi:3'-phosphoadenosine 5'-phosphosulfate (PAPS) 3'-phosphatase
MATQVLSSVANPVNNSTQQFVVDPSQTYTCHLELVDYEKPVAAIAYQGKFYSFFRACPDWQNAEKIAGRMKEKFVITRIKKGWAIWLYEF